MTVYAGPPVFPPYFVDPSGDPQESVSITVYNRDTTVKPTIYTDRTKATPLANPFTADSLGNADFYVDPGQYDALVSGVTFPFTVVLDPSEPLSDAVDVHVAEYAEGVYANGVVDDTAAILAALVAYLALPVTGRRHLVFGPGDWRCTDLGAPSVITAERVKVRGAGKGCTNLWFRGTGAWLTFGEFDATPASFYIGTASDWAIWDMTLFGLDYAVSPSVYASEGARTRTAIRDNGSGNGHAYQCEFKAWQYGIAAPYGSDFTAIEDCLFRYNDIGVYLGPCSQQHHVNRCEFSAGVEGLVMENVKQGEVSNCWFVDQTTADITFDYNTSTRFGVSPIQQDNAMDLSVAVNDCWFESGAGFTHDNIPPRHVWLKGDNADLSYPRHIKINRPHLVGGGATSATNSFLDMDRGKFIEVNDLLVTGENVRYAVDIDAAVAALFAPVIQRNTVLTDGYTNLVLWNNEHSGCTTEDATNRRRFGNAPATVVESTRVTGDAFDRLAITAEGGLKMGSGAAAQDWSLRWISVQTVGSVGSVRFSPAQAAGAGVQFMRFSAGQVGNVVTVRRAEGEDAATVGAIGPDLSMNIPLKYKSGAGATITDADFPLLTVTDGLTAVCRDTTAGVTYFYVRGAGAWTRVATA